MTISELRNELQPQQIIDILHKYDIKPVVDNINTIIFPTCCHNLHGGSPKLYYYKNSHLFKCFTQCEGSFDIFELIIKIEGLRGNTITLFGALKIAGVDIKNTDLIASDDHSDVVNYMYEFSNSLFNINNLTPIDDNVLNASVFKKEVLSLWEREGINYTTMQKYNIGYDPLANCITIPIYDHFGQLVSVRGRFLSEGEKVKYKPITFCNKILSAPSSQLLYGLWQNRNSIQQTKTAIVFESEKSVLMMDSYYGDKNNSVATLGKNISNQHILLLLRAGVEKIILAYDADYKTEEEKMKKFQEYKSIGKFLSTFFSTSIIIDWDNKLQYKDSPIDRGKQIFETLLEKRYYVEF